MSYSVSLVSSFEQLCQAFSLTYSRYLEKGYATSHSSRMRFGPLQLLPVSHTYVAIEDQEVVGTGSIVTDSIAGLPCEDQFHEVLDKLREEGRRMAEGTMFACAEHSRSNGKMINLSILRALFWWCVANGVDDVIVVVNPKHVPFYKRLLGFTEVAELASCSHVNGAAGHLLRLDISSLLRSSGVAPSRVRKVFGLDDMQTIIHDTGYALNREDVATLISMRPEIYRGMNREARELFVEHYGVFVMTKPGREVSARRYSTTEIPEAFIVASADTLG